MSVQADKSAYVNSCQVRCDGHHNHTVSVEPCMPHIRDYVDRTLQFLHAEELVPVIARGFRCKAVELVLCERTYVYSESNNSTICPRLMDPPPHSCCIVMAGAGVSVCPCACGLWCVYIYMYVYILYLSRHTLTLTLR